MNTQLVSERLHIGFFGCRNAGKSSLVNAVTGQEVSVVSNVLGTTTDPVTKTMEILPLGPVVVIDTPGFDDCGTLGEKRIERTKKILEKTDIAVLVCDAQSGMNDVDRTLLKIFSEKGVSCIVAYNKADLCPQKKPEKDNEIYVSALCGTNIYELKEKIGHIRPDLVPQKNIVDGIVKKGDTVILVTPIDEAAPKGRLILPQQNVLRGVLDIGAAALTLQPDMLQNALGILNKKPDLVITDSQAFKEVSQIVPQDIPLTSFSIVMARYKGFLETAVKGVGELSRLNDGDKILIAEGCTHHRQCNDIGSVKLPRLIRAFSKKQLEFDITAGHDFPDELSKYRLVIHCGGCMITEREVCARRQRAAAQGIPFTNYGTALAYLNKILERSLSVFPDVQRLIKN